MQGLGQNYKEAKAHKKFLHPWHRRTSSSAPTAHNPLPTECFPSHSTPINNQTSQKQLPVAQKPGFLFRNGTYIPYSSLSGPTFAIKMVLIAQRASAQHSWTYLNVCTIGTQKQHYLVVVTAKASQNMQQIRSIPTVPIFQTDLLGKRKICSTSHPSSSASAVKQHKPVRSSCTKRAARWSSMNRDGSETAQNGEKTQTNSSQKEALPDVLHW